VLYTKLLRVLSEQKCAGKEAALCSFFARRREFLTKEIS